MKRRPVNLNLFTIHFPLPSIVSILHRVSGIFIFLVIPLLLWGLQESLVSEQHFETFKNYFKNSIISFILWGILAALIYHLIAGIRHLLMDIHIGESKQGGRLGGLIVIVLSVIFILGTGYWLWFMPPPT